MDPELQALREARLAELKNKSNGGGNRSSANDTVSSIGSSIVGYLEPEALERLKRVSLVKPERAQSVENYLKQIISGRAIRSKISEDEIVQILNGIAREENKKNETKIIFNRKNDIFNEVSNLKENSNDDDEDDDFFD
ncbi:hypothetical protein TBLA_0G02270 [Henningerozyma blattae CBS 6284]|uniref:DNA-binding TFAR19-related protein n=1 Tax=Henningerozyma blattae (strain ATCC 34711 / CBS 6284 / DSM 70876 / NBRC 10599 / NRRL Y-10934 / UCD 77-7) TaxID=1071380 RepID=I2H715_HENB6|nr:hypothetical protein TBLA_0G02270 [Tetrapisispora blattae CBS 6284]CCH62167.1 hypothetical protein TBLA_0G02270 [Tetrapisispora blattae CBS 6284]